MSDKLTINFVCNRKLTIDFTFNHKLTIHFILNRRLSIHFTLNDNLPVHFTLNDNILNRSVNGEVQKTRFPMSCFTNTTSRPRFEYLDVDWAQFTGTALHMYPTLSLREKSAPRYHLYWSTIVFQKTNDQAQIREKGPTTEFSDSAQLLMELGVELFSHIFL